VCHEHTLVTGHRSAVGHDGAAAWLRPQNWHCFADCKFDDTDRWEIGEGQGCLDNVGDLVAAIRHVERHAETSYVGSTGREVLIQSGVVRR